VSIEKIAISRLSVSQKPDEWSQWLFHFEPTVRREAQATEFRCNFLKLKLGSLGNESADHPDLATH
jgi:hypothetical protein